MLYLRSFSADLSPFKDVLLTSRTFTGHDACANRICMVDQICGNTYADLWLLFSVTPLAEKKRESGARLATRKRKRGGVCSFRFEMLRFYFCDLKSLSSSTTIQPRSSAAATEEISTEKRDDRGRRQEKKNDEVCWLWCHRCLWMLWCVVFKRAGATA